MPRNESIDSAQLENILRRALELQEQSHRRLDRADVVRIAREVGVEARHVQQAIDELEARQRPRDPYQTVVWIVVVLGFILVLWGIVRVFRDGF